MAELKNIIGQFVTGSFVKLVIRQKSDQEFQLGQLIVAGNSLEEYSIFQIKDLFYGSQIPDDILELMAGYRLEIYKTSYYTGNTHIGKKLGMRIFCCMN